jgi:predicted permease
MRFEHWLYTIPLRFRSLFRRNQIEKELDEELQFHLEQRIQLEMAAGQTRERARSTALRAMEGIEQRKEECRDMRRLAPFNNLQGDLRYALRALKNNPGFAATAMITLAIGIGANTAIFSLIDTVMLKLLPVKTPEQLFLVGNDRRHTSMTWNYPDYRAMRQNNSVFEGLAGYSLNLESLGIQTSSGAGLGAELSHGIFVSGNYFEVLGVSPALGRVFNAGDDRAPGTSPYAVLSYEYWQSRFDGDAQIIGRRLRVNGYPLTVIGVAPHGFDGINIAYKPSFFLPIMMRSEVLRIPYITWDDRHYWWLAAIGRIKPGVNLKTAESELFNICRRQTAAEASNLADASSANAADKIVLEPAARGLSFQAAELKKPLLILFVIVGLVLVIACANMANLMIARGAARQREIAVRLAIGAVRSRVISQLLTESLLIAVLGGAAGILVALVGIHVLLHFLPQSGAEPLAGINPSIDWLVLAFTTTVSILTGLLFGIAPAWQSTRPDLLPSIKEDVPASTGTRRFTIRKGLVILQVGLSLPLLVVASLFARTLGNLRELNPGFAAKNVYIASVDPTRFGLKGQRAREFYDQLCERTAALPGVRVASLAFITPLTGSSWDGSVTVEGYSWKPGQRNNTFLNAVGPRYFEAMGTPFRLGRDFTQQDNPATAIEVPARIVPGMKLDDPPGRHVAIVNETFARHFFGDHGPLGMHATLGGPYTGSYEIVGVVKDAHYSDLRSVADPMMFLPVWRSPVMQRVLVIRSNQPASQLATLLVREIHKLDPVIPLLNLRLFERDVDQSILVERLVATLSGFFALLAVLLCAVGLYGVVAYTVTRRTREIGIRLALGAGRQSVLLLVLADVVAMVLIGAAIGTSIAMLATRTVVGMLYDVAATDPISMIAAAACLLTAAVVASVLPARRAAAVDPLTALRYE